MILVTGGTGFIGSRLVKRLVGDGYAVACICREETDYARVNEIYNDIVWVNNSMSEIEQAFKDYKVEGVIHIATAYGRKADQFYDVMEANVNFPLKLLHMASLNGCAYFINTDSFFTREMEGGWIAGSQVYMNAYTKSKFIFRETVRENIASVNVAFINMELQHIYGAGDADGKFLTYIVNELKNNVPEIELTEGTQTRDWTYVDDVVEAYLAVIKNAGSFKCRKFYGFEVGTGVETSLREFCEKMKEYSRSGTILGFGKRAMHDKELDHAMADNAGLKKLGWRPGVDVDEGIRRLFENSV